MSFRHDFIVYDPEDDFWLYTGYPGYYVSYQGYVIGPGRHGEEQLLIQRPGNNYGHLSVDIHVNGKRIHKYVHKLVAKAFVRNPRPDIYNVVRHIDGDVENNCADNLEWGTQLDNVRDSIYHGTFRYFTREDIEKANETRRRPIICIDLLTGEKMSFVSQEEASRVLRISQAGINNVLRKKSRSVYDYYFEYDDEDEHVDIDIENYTRVRHKALIKATDVITGEEFIFNGQTEAANELGMSVASVSNVLKGKQFQTKGYKFEYLNERGNY